MSEMEKEADLICALLHEKRSFPKVICKNVFLKVFAKFTGMQLGHILFFSKVAG